jgi:hypothetical protein
VPVIVVNSNDNAPARIFTLFHEFAHLMLRESATCVLRTTRGMGSQRIERWCNSFAAAFLMPELELRRAIDDRFADLRPSEWELRHVERLAREFRVSRIAMALRLKELKITNFYDSRNATLFAYDRKPVRKHRQASGMIIPHAVRLGEVGSAGATIILDALKGNAIDAFEAADILDLSPGQLQQFEKRVEKQRIRDAPS